MASVILHRPSVEEASVGRDGQLKPPLLTHL